MKTVIKNLIQECIQFANDELGESITYKSNVYSAVLSDIVKANKTEIDGLVDLPDLIIYLPKSELATEPETGNQITVRNKIYRIEKVTDTADECEWIINCMGK